MTAGNRSHWIAVVVACVSTATLLRLLLHSLLDQRAVFLVAVLAVAVSAHLAGLWAGLATTFLAVPLAAALFMESPGPGGTPAWFQVLLPMLLALFLSLLGGRFHDMVRELDQALRRERAARSEAEQANRARDEFVAVLSHELRSPLNAIVGWAHVLKEKVRDPDAARGIETILRNADHQVRLISDVTDLSRGIAGKLALERDLLDVRSVIDQAVDAARLSANARAIRFSVALPDPPLLVRGDPARLRQVFWNLLSNAIKFSSPGATVLVTAGTDGERVVVKVKDQGQGIGSEFLPHVFDLFRQQDATRSRSQGGLGIGLAIVRHLTEAHGGTVAADSQGPGMGAEFTVTLPCAGAGLDAIAPSVLGNPQLAGVRVLVVDDDRDTRDLLARSLGELGATVVSASSAAEARREIGKQRPDAIVSDIGMPDEDGLAFVRSLKKDEGHARIPAIALTAYASSRDREEVLAAGYCEHVSKPAPPYQIARVIAAAVRRPS